MGVSYIPLPLDEKTKEWLIEESVPFPEKAESRLPSVDDIKDVISSLDGFKITNTAFEIGKPCIIEVESLINEDSYTSLVIDKLRKKNNLIQFEKGDPYLVADILKRLSRHIGYIALTTDSGEGPFLIHESSDIKELIDNWLYSEDEFISASFVSEKLSENFFKSTDKEGLIFRRKLFDDYSLEIEIEKDDVKSFEGISYYIYSKKFQNYIHEVFLRDHEIFRSVSIISGLPKSNVCIANGNAFWWLDERSNEYMFHNGGKQLSLDSYIEIFNNLKSVSDLYEFLFVSKQYNHGSPCDMTFVLLLLFFQMGLQVEEIIREIQTGVPKNWAFKNKIDRILVTYAQTVYTYVT